MRISYDKQADALYIRLLEGDFECRTVRLSDSVALNIGPARQLVGVEVLDAAKTLNLESKPEMILDNISARVNG